MRLIHRISVSADRSVNVYRNAEWAEWVVHVVKGGQKGSGYHTSDKDDAMSTAAHIAANLPEVR